ncbi:hypothetical protein JC221_274, partial [Yersinia phage JC221]
MHDEIKEALKREEHENMVVSERNEQIKELTDTPVYDQALRKAEKFLKKNRREWKRLHKHAEEALFDNNKDQYVYAIKKMRDMLRQPYTEELID